MDANGSKALQLVNWIIDQAIDGVPPLSSAEDLAQEYLMDESYSDHDARIASMINWETSKNFTSGFVTGLGGILTLPVAVPAALGASWVIQARMCGAVGKIYGHDLREDRVRTLVLLSLVGDSVKEILKEAGVKIGTQVTRRIVTSIPGRILIDINKKVGFRLLTKAGSRGVVNLIRAVPVAGGVVCGGFDAYACRIVGKTAQELFRSI